MADEGTDPPFSPLGPIVISVIVMTIFGILAILLFTHSIPQEQKDLVLVVVGGFNTLAATVVAYWMGSSAGSVRKSATINNLLNKAADKGG